MFGGGPPAAELASPPPVDARAAERSTGADLRGTISLAAGATAPDGAVLFVIVRNAGGPERGPPLAVRRFDSPSFPLTFDVGASHVMLAGMPFTGPFDVTARLDGDGNAMTRAPTDLASPPLRSVAPGAHGLALVLGGEPSAASPSAPSQPSPASQAPAVAPTAAAAAPVAGGSIRGRVAVSPSLGEPGGGTLFVIVRAAGSPDRGPPVAVRKYDGPTFPLAFEVGPADVMLDGVAFAGPFDVWARLDRDGDAASRAPGDLEASGAALGAVAGGPAVDVVLDRRR